MNRTLVSALNRTNRSTPPIWFMRQAGRYHAHYQALRKQHSFIDLCKNPKLACETTLGPMRDFDFDAAILFSDLLFPLEAMGLGLTYDPGPKLGRHLETIQDVERLQNGAGALSELAFQREAMREIRKNLDSSKALIGFVGGPFTLFAYAVDGSHQGGIPKTKGALEGKLWDNFCAKLLPLLIQNMGLQAQGGPDVIAVLDTCAGEIDPELYARRVVPWLGELFSGFRKLHPEMPILYYSKKTDRRHWECLRPLPFAALGVDWNVDMAQTLRDFGSRWAIQGNFDPHLLFGEDAAFETAMENYFRPIQALKAEQRQGWISGLGHGVMPGTPEQHVKRFIEKHRQLFGVNAT